VIQEAGNLLPGTAVPPEGLTRVKLRWQISQMRFFPICDTIANTKKYIRIGMYTYIQGAVGLRVACWPPNGPLGPSGWRGVILHVK